MPDYVNQFSNLRRTILRATNAAKKMQVAQVQEGKGKKAPVDEAEHFEFFGLTAHAMPGAEALVSSVDGATDHPVVVAVADRRHRPKDLEKGETCLHNAHGKQVRLEDDRIVHVSEDIRLGSNNAALRVARETDTIVVDDPAFALWISQVTTFINGLVPGTVTPFGSAPTGVINKGSDVTRSD